MSMLNTRPDKEVMTRHRNLLTGLVLAGLGVLPLSVNATAASQGTGEGPKTPPGAHLQVAGAPAGYAVVDSAVLASPNQTQQRGTVECPAGTVPLGGGVFISSVNTLANVNSSFPTPTGWAGDVNNASGVDTTFVVQVVCGTQPAHYRIVESSPVVNAATSQNEALVTCPKGSKPLGGGGLSSGGTVDVNMNSTSPLRRAWSVVENNASDSDRLIQAFAVCGKVPGYAVVRGSTSLNPAGSQSAFTVTCPAPKLPVGGGVISSSTSVAVNLNSSLSRVANDWEAFMNNASQFDTVATPIVVCAGA